jgi:Protein of unknown function (DUF1706)
MAIIQAFKCQESSCILKETTMEERMTKAELISLLEGRRAEWDALVARVPAERLTEPGATGHWSVKDIIAHMTSYERWFADRLAERLRGETYTPTAEDTMGEARNDLFYERDKDLPLADVQEQSRRAFDELMSGVRANDEAFLIEPQLMPGVPVPVTVWKMLRGDVYDHYPEHVASVAAWLEELQAS